MNHLKKSYFELGQVFEILNRHYAIPILIQITKMFFHLLADCYSIASMIIRKLNVKKGDSFLMTCSELILICYSKVNFSSEENFMEYKRECSSSIDVPYNNRTSTDESIDLIEGICILLTIIYEITKLFLLIFSMEKLAKYKSTMLNILKR